MKDYEFIDLGREIWEDMKLCKSWKESHEQETVVLFCGDRVSVGATVRVGAAESEGERLQCHTKHNFHLQQVFKNGVIALMSVDVCKLYQISTEYENFRDYPDIIKVVSGDLSDPLSH